MNTIDVIKVVMHSGRSPYRWNHNIKDIIYMICVICFKIPSIDQNNKLYCYSCFSFWLYLYSST